MLNQFELPQTDAEAVARLYAPFPAEDTEFHGYFNFAYLKEEAINTRLTQVFGIAGWSKVIVDRQFVPAGEPVVEWVEGRDKNYILLSQLEEFGGITLEREAGKIYWHKPNSKSAGGYDREPLSVIHDVPFIVYTGYLEVEFNGKKAQYWSSGADVLTNLGKEPGARLMNTYKAADTDLLKRVARGRGVGLYLTQIKKADPKVTNEKTLALWLLNTYGVVSECLSETEIKTAFAQALSDKFEINAIAPALAALGLKSQDIIDNYAATLAALKAA